MNATYSHSQFTAFDGVDVSASEQASPRGAKLGPNVQVSFPDSQWDRTTYYREFPTLDEAKEAGKQIAAQLKPLCPKKKTGFYPMARLNEKTPANGQIRERVEQIVKEWAGENAVVIAVN